MSVAPSLATLPDHRCPARLRALHPGATGRDSDRVFRMGESAFRMANVAPGLQLRPDDVPNPRHGRFAHGIVQPVERTPLASYERDLAATRDAWCVDETGET